MVMIWVNNQLRFHFIAEWALLNVLSKQSLNLLLIICI